MGMRHIRDTAKSRWPGGETWLEVDRVGWLGGHSEWIIADMISSEKSAVALLKVGSAYARIDPDNDQQDPRIWFIISCAKTLRT